MADQIDDALNKGAILETGIPPERVEHMTVLISFGTDDIYLNVNHSMKVMNEESFGPLLPIIPFDTEEEVIVLQMKVNMDLNSSVWTMDEQKASRIGRHS